jgi:hypothetical protein
MMGFDRHFNEIYYKYEPMGMILRDIVEISCGYRRGSFVASNITINIIYIYMDVPRHRGYPKVVVFDARGAI